MGYATIELWFYLQDLAQESREELIKAGEITPPEQKKEGDKRKKEKGCKSTGPLSVDHNIQGNATTGQVATGGGNRSSSLLEEKARAMEHRSKHFSPVSKTFLLYDSPPIIPVFPPGSVSVAKNVVVKKTQPWRDSYELFQLT